MRLYSGIAEDFVGEVQRNRIAELLETAPDGCLAQIARVIGGAIGVELDGSSSATLAAGIEEWSGERVALIIDDLHAIASTMAESELGRLIDRLPAKLL